MYTEFYGLREKPFSLSPDPRFLFLSDSHREALAHLLYGIEQGEGFIAITGEVGTGKTTLCRTLLQRLEPGSEVAFLFNPQLSGLELLQAIDGEFGIETEGRSRRELMDQLNRFLLTKRQEGRRVLLLIDEAQNLEREALEQVRLLSNLETDTTKLIQIILIGQPELDALLESPELRQLRQRISVRWRLRPLSTGETRDYVRHRLRVAAGGARDVFTDLALREIHRRSGGVPRVINRLCDRALLLGYAEGAKEIGLGTLAEVQRELAGRDGVVKSPRSESLRERLAQQPTGAAVAAGAFLAVALAAGFAWWNARAEAPRASASVAALLEPEPPAAPLPAVAAAPPEAAEPALALEEPGPEAEPAAGAPPQAAVPLDFPSTLARSSPAATVAASLDALLVRWGVDPLGAEVLSLAQFRELLENAGFALLTLDPTSLEELAAIDRPSLLVLTALDGAARALLLTAIDGDLVTLEGVGPVPLRISRSELAANWAGRALVPWKDPEALPRLVGPGTSGPPVRWLQRALATLGVLEGAPTGAFDARTERAVRSFQADESLEVDGWVGPLTLIRLYERLPGYGEPPRLASSSGEHPIAAHEGTS